MSPNISTNCIGGTMFEFNQNTKTSNDISTIVSNYNVILYYDEPILYFGSNTFNSKIIGCLIDSSIESGMKYDYIIIVTDNDLDRFIDGLVPLKQLMGSNPVFIKKTSLTDETIETYLLEYVNIPEEFLPSNDSLCPEEFDIPSNYTEISLVFKGSEADQNAMDIDNFKQWVDHSTPLVKQPFEILKNAIPSFQYNVNVLAKAGSFKFIYRYELMHDGNRSFLLDNQKDTLEFLVSSYLTYLFKEIYVQDEVNSINAKHISENLQKIIDIVNKFCDDNGYPNVDNVNSFVLASVSKAINHMNEINKRIIPSYDSLTLESKYPSELVSRTSKSKYIEDAAVLQSSFDEAIEQSLDIAIYKLSTKTKKGNAYLYYNTAENPEEKLIVDVGITIDTKDHIDNTDFTESLHKNKVITVTAKKEIDHNTKKVKRLIIAVP